MIYGKYFLSMLHYSELTPTQKQEITNGCGAKGSWIKVPNFLFKASCNQHDFYYWRGATEKYREKADKEFYDMMKIDIASRNYWFVKRMWYKTWAKTYYEAVRLGGAKAFYYAKEQRTEADLIA